MLFVTAAVIAFRAWLGNRISKSLFFPLVLALILYFFIVVSNLLEQSGITAYFDPTEDIAEILFILLFLFFFNNWRKQISYENVRRHETWLKVTLESIADGVMTTDQDGRIRQMNPTMESFLGCPLKDAAGRFSSEILHFQDRKGDPIDYNPLNHVIEGRIFREYPGGLMLCSQAGTATLVTDTTSPIYSEHGERIGAVSVFRDMSEYQSMTEQLLHVHKMEALGQLAGGVAHDLNNMLGGIMGAADLLHGKFSDEEHKKYDRIVDILLKSSRNASDLTSNLLTFSRRGKYVSAPVVIQDVVNTTVALAERTIGKLITLYKRLTDDALVVIGDSSQISSALLNMVLNARDAMPRGGEMVIAAEKIYLDKVYCSKSTFDIHPGFYVILSVSDTGEGIAPENLSRIFEPFFTTKEEGKGTGLGLAAVYGMASNHQGAVTVQSTLGKGSVFSLYLPLTEASSLPVTSRSASSAMTGTGEILVIDDEEMLCEFNKMLLEQNGYGVFTASSGREGLEIYKKHEKEIQLVLLDMAMPGMDGAQVFRYLREINPVVKVLITSGYTSEEKVPDGVLGFLKKPYRAKDLVEAISQALSRNNA